MPMIVRALSFPSHWWPSLLVGAVLGAGVFWLAVSGRFRRRADPDNRGLRARLKRRQVEPDLDELAALLRAWPGAEELRMRSFGHGILELVGSAGDELDIAALIRVLTADPEVSAVVNRVWIAASGAAT